MLTKRLFAFALAIVVAIAAGVYKDGNDRERLSFKFTLPVQKETVHKIDIAQQGIVKKILQPNKITIHGSGQLKDYQGDVYVKLVDAPNHFLSQGGKKHVWAELKNTDKAQVSKTGRMPVSIELDIPKELLTQYQVAAMDLYFSDGTQDLGKIRLVVINSDYADKQ